MQNGLKSAPDFGAEKTNVETKSSKTGALMSLMMQGQPVWTSRDQGSLVREGFMKNPIVFRCVRMIAESCSRIQLFVQTPDMRLDTHPLLELLSKPNPSQSGVDLIDGLVTSLILTGNGYLEAALLNGDVHELYHLRSDRMRAILGQDGWPEAYEYRVGNRAVRFDQHARPIAPIAHLKLSHPIDDHYGLSPLEAAATSLDLHNASSAWNKALLDNSARPSGALVYKADLGKLSAEQFERLKRELEDNFQGAHNAGRPLLLEGGLEWEAMSLSPKELDFHQTRDSAARDIALAFGIPPMLLAIPGDNSFSNYAEAQRVFWRQTIIPLSHKIASVLNRWLAPNFGDDVQLKPNIEGIEALAGERAKLWDMVNAADFLTDDEKRAMLGLGSKTQDNEDKC